MPNFVDNALDQYNRGWTQLYGGTPVVRNPIPQPRMVVPPPTTPLVQPTTAPIQAVRPLVVPNAIGGYSVRPAPTSTPIAANPAIGQPLGAGESSTDTGAAPDSPSQTGFWTWLQTSFLPAMTGSQVSSTVPIASNPEVGQPYGGSSSFSPWNYWLMNQYFQNQGSPFGGGGWFGGGAPAQSAPINAAAINPDTLVGPVNPGISSPTTAAGTSALDTASGINPATATGASGIDVAGNPIPGAGGGGMSAGMGIGAALGGIGSALSAFSHQPTFGYSSAGTPALPSPPTMVYPTLAANPGIHL